MTSDLFELTALRSTELSLEDVPTRILVAPWGNVESVKGDFVMDAESAGVTCAAFGQHGTDLPIDFEHQTLGGSYSSPDGLAPAAGWIKNLEAVEAVGLMADVEWTDLGLEHLLSKQYRYLSPVAIIRQSDRRMVGLHSAALTNKPAIVGMAAIVNSGQQVAGSRQPEADSESGEVQSKAGPSPNPSLEGRGVGEWEPEAVGEQMESESEAIGKLCELLGLGEEVEPEKVLAMVVERVEQLLLEKKQRAAEGQVAEAMSAGKLTESQRAWAIELAMRDPKSFESWVNLSPVIVPMGRTQAPKDRNGSCPTEKAIMSRARQEYRSSPTLRELTSEEAYVQLTLKERGLKK